MTLYIEINKEQTAENIQLKLECAGYTAIHRLNVRDNYILVYPKSKWYQGAMYLPTSIKEEPPTKLTNL